MSTNITTQVLNQSKGSPADPHHFFIHWTQLYPQVDLLSPALVLDAAGTFHTQIPGAPAMTFEKRGRIVFWPKSKRDEYIQHILKDKRSEGKGEIPPLFPAGATNCCVLVLMNSNGPCSMGICWGEGVPVWTLSKMSTGITPRINVEMIKEISDRAKDDGRRVVDILGRNLLQKMDTALQASHVPGIPVEALREVRKGENNQFKVFRCCSAKMSLDVALIVNMTVEALEGELMRQVDEVVKQLADAHASDATVKYLRPGIEASFKLENYMLDLFFHIPCVRRATKEEKDEMSCDRCGANLDGLAPSMPYEAGTRVTKPCSCKRKRSG
jgi:hypothetical protein